MAGAKGVPIILLDHQQSDARHAANLGVALQLSGHTYGGLIRGTDRLAVRANAGYVSRPVKRASSSTEFEIVSLIASVRQADSARSGVNKIWAESNL